MKSSYAHWVVLLAAILANDTARAAEHGWYLGAAYSDVSPDVPSSSITFSNVRFEDDGYKVFAGFRAFDWLAVEAEYGDFGDTHEVLDIVCITTPCPVEFSTSTTAVSVSALGLFSIGEFDLFARAGFTSWRGKLELQGSSPSQFISTTEKESGTDALFGAGAQYNFSRVVARLEYGRFEFGSSEADVWSAGLAWSFH